jgi:hypothetical protein
VANRDARDARPRSTSEARQVFVLATVVPPSARRMMERSSLQSLHLSLLPARAKQHRSAEQVPLPLAKARTTRQLQLQAHLREAAD